MQKEIAFSKEKSKKILVEDIEDQRENSDEFWNEEEEEKNS